LQTLEQIHTLLPTDTIARAMELFGANHILSAPVMDRIIASIDLADCLAHALHVKRTIKQRSMLSAILHQATIADVLKLSAVEPPCLLPADTATVYDVCRELGTLGGKHRVLLIDKSGAISRFISQSDCVCLVKQHAEQNADVRAMLDAPIESFVSNRVAVVKPVNTMLETGRIRDAIFRLVHLGGALPIVTRQGELVAHLSKSDLKQLLDVRGVDFEQNVVEFLQHFSPKSLKVRGVFGYGNYA
jgi:hypothetical protein